MSAQIINLNAYRDAKKLEQLIEQYATAIFIGNSTEEIDRLFMEVEAEAERINYQGHDRLLTLHSAAEQASRRLTTGSGR
jgi:hypothetical protein